MDKKARTSIITRHLSPVMVLLVLLLCLAASKAYGSRTLKVNIGIELLDNGDAIVTEERIADISSYGTEGYIAQYNLRPGMRIADLQVSDETGIEYELVEKWDVDRSRKQKTNKCGYNMTDKGVELCWGIGEPGMRTYYIRYRVVGLLMGYKESDGFNHCFFSTSEAGVDSVSLTFYSKDKVFEQYKPKVWMFGCYGNINVVDGKAEANLTDFITSGEEMVVMMEFPKGMFHPSVNVDSDFKTQVKDIALEGSSYAEVALENNPSPFAHIAHDPDQWMFALGGLVSLLITTFLGGLVVSDENKKKQMLVNLFGKKKNILWYRDVPVNGNLLRARAIYHAVEGELFKTDDTIAAYTLRLMLQKKIEVRRRTNADGTYEDLLLVNDPQQFNDTREDQRETKIQKSIHQLYYDAAGTDHLLEPKEIKKYFNDNPVMYRKNVREIDGILTSSGNMQLKSVKREEAHAVLGFEKFLREFTLLSERGTMEATLWKEYMTFATMFGISKRVAKELRAMLPEMPVSDVELYNSISEAPLFYYAASSLNSGMQHVRDYKTPEERAYESSSSRSSGGGGHSSYSGGGGHSGGGGSGFR